MLLVRKTLHTAHKEGYLSEGVPGLEHQRVESFDTKKYNKVDDGWYARGQFKVKPLSLINLTFPGTCCHEV